ncbi:MAG: hypothetical protein HC840_17985 [Leptolyngbyaceae cyanobacterium RM2_2_4]|nr:hypothetical protein [Leptolyngbyaceae cyanobacterium SM1_4_3]NJO51020.1 hypothetical protein [Leptolyngbyaceae cyanobacterium RM2_2_4]
MVTLCCLVNTFRLLCGNSFCIISIERSPHPTKLDRFAAARRRSAMRSGTDARNPVGSPFTISPFRRLPWSTHHQVSKF